MKEIPVDKKQTTIVSVQPKRRTRASIKLLNVSPKPTPDKNPEHVTLDDDVNPSYASDDTPDNRSESELDDCTHIVKTSPHHLLDTTADSPSGGLEKVL